MRLPAVMPPWQSGIFCCLEEAPEPAIEERRPLGELTPSADDDEASAALAGQARAVCGGERAAPSVCA